MAEKQNKAYIIPDIHCRSFYKPVLDIKDVPIIFLGDYMDPYGFEDTHDEQGIENLKEIIEFAKKNSNVHLLIGNHDISFIFGYYGCERTLYKYYDKLHELYTDNIDLFKAAYQVDNILFTHAGVSNGWINMMNSDFEYRKSDFRLIEETIAAYINNEFLNSLKKDDFDFVSNPIYCVGNSRGGDAPFGGPVWNDFNWEFYPPNNWRLCQVFGHSQGRYTGQIRQKEGCYCLDSRAIFEMDLDTHEVVFSSINHWKTVEQKDKPAW